MLNISELTGYYINTTFHEGVTENIYSSFSLLESFNSGSYEDKYISLIERSDAISNTDKSDQFIMYLESDIRAIIDAHSVYVSKDINITLNELNEVCHFLYIVQNLEDYSYISYRVNAEDTDRNIICDLIVYLTLLDKPRVMEIIESVSPNLISAIKEIAKDKYTISDEVNKLHLTTINNFFKFIKSSECLGYKYFNQGYKDVTLETLVNLLDIDLPDYIDKLTITNSAQAGLDILSLLIISKDTYELPLLKFKQFNSYFTNNLTHTTKLNYVITAILSDFGVFLNILEQRKKEDSKNGN